MKSKTDSTSSKKKWSLKPGWMQFLVILPPPLSELFTAEMVAQRRKKLPMARWIIEKYFEEQALRKNFDEFKQFQSASRSIPHFGDEPAPRQAEAARKFPR